MWDTLPDEADLVVIGGGITGAGAARDAARRGLKTVLLEMNDLAYGTSSRSSKLVHGGLRYLEHYEFSLVFEAVSERRILMDLAPHIVNPLGFVFPVYEGARRRLWVINAGMWLYDGLSLFRSPRIHRSLTRTALAEEVPMLKQDGLKGAPLYWDCSTDDARLTLETALDAAGAGACVATRAKVTGFDHDEQGRISAVVVHDEVSGEQRKVNAKVVLNATGPWTDAVRNLSAEEGIGERVLRPTKGVHIVVDAAKLRVPHAIVCFHPTDGRVLFALPWGERTYIGTTDTDYEGDPGDVAATSEDIDYLINASNAYFPDNELTRDDVISTWAGLRPLVAPPSDDGEVAESQVSREHQILVGHNGLVSIAGGKLTTYRRMAAEAVDMCVRMLEMSGFDDDHLESARTHKEPLPGAVGWPDDDDHDKVAAQVLEASGGSIEADTARLLGDTYGMRGLDIAKRCAADRERAARLIEGRPEVVAQVDWAVEEELACSLCDVLIRRTQVFFRDFDQGLGCAEAVGARMQKLLGWTDEQREESIAEYRAEVDRSRAWMTAEERAG